MIALLAAALAATAPAEPGARLAPGQCIQTGVASRAEWTPVGDDRTVLVREGPRAWKVTTAACPRLSDPFAVIAIEARGVSQVCGPLDVRLFVTEPGLSPSRTSCAIQSVTTIGEAEARALKPRVR